MVAAAIPLLTAAAGTAGTATAGAAAGGFLSSVGGIAGALSIGSGLFSAYSTLQAGRAQSDAYNIEAQQMQMQAEFERTRAMQEEANRQARLNEILGLQMASQAGRGVALGSGTDLAITAFSEEEARRESDIANLDSKFRQTQLKSQAKQATMSGKASLLESRYRAAGTMFDTGVKVYDRKRTT